VVALLLRRPRVAIAIAIAIAVLIFPGPPSFLIVAAELVVRILLPLLLRHQLAVRHLHDAVEEVASIAIARLCKQEKEGKPEGESDGGAPERRAENAGSGRRWRWRWKIELGRSFIAISACN
jgi:hypothetical protein